MTDTSSQRHSESSTSDSTWAWHPSLPVEFGPVFIWPPQPLKTARYLLGGGYLVSQNLIYFAVAMVSWFYLLPPIEDCKTFSFDWIAQLLILNLAVVVIVAGGLHFYFYTFKREGDKRRYDATPLGRNNPKFLGGNQVLDNMFYTTVSGMSILTAFQAIVLWAYANGVAPWLDWDVNPVWFVLLFPALSFFGSLHFYLIHRLLHWRRLYKLAHALHHRNINVGPWSGLSMHPIEHLLYFSFVFVHLVVAAHPLHLFFLSYAKVLSAITSHSGYANVFVKDNPVMDMGEFFHQLHHRYFDCNYGTLLMPWDKWLGSVHDGTAQATKRIRQLQRERQLNRRAGEVTDS